MSPSRTYDLHAEQRPSRQPCIRWMPWRKAASRMFSSSPTSISMSTGSKLMRCMSATEISSAALVDVGVPGWVLDGACAIRRDVRVALLVAHVVEQYVRAVERVDSNVVERPHLRRVEIEMRLPDERLAVVAHVAEIGDDVGEVPAVVQCLPFPESSEPSHVRRRPALVLAAECNSI